MTLEEFFMQNAQPVRSHDDANTPEDLYHMLGNVMEWTESHGLAIDTDGTRRPDFTVVYVLGGDWSVGKRGTDLRGIMTLPKSPEHRLISVGFRCARSLELD